MSSALNDQLFDAVKNNKLQEVILYLSKGADVKAQDQRITLLCLQWAFLNNYTEIAKILIDNMLSNNSEVEKPWFLYYYEELSAHWDYTKSGLLLKKLGNKADNLHYRGHDEAASEAKHIVKLLHELSQACFFTKKMSYSNYLSVALDVINQNRSELDRHRGYKQILGNLVIGIATLGTAQLLNKACSGHFLFFRKTDSSNCIDNLINTIENEKSSSSYLNH